MIKILLILIALLLNQNSHASVSANVDKVEINLGEQFQLVITLDRASNEVPDLTSLRNNFRLLATEQSQQYTNINGQIKNINQWIFILEPLKEGKLLIPQIKFGSELTQAISVNVRKVNNTTKFNYKSISQDEDAFIKMQFKPKKAYVNQAIMLKVKIYSKYDVLDINFAPPSVEHSLLISVEPYKRYQKIVNGVNYRVQEIDYAVFPQKSGKLKVKNSPIELLLASPIPRRVRLDYKDLNLIIKHAKISGMYGQKDWLPTKNLKIFERYNEDLKSVQVGDVITRLITIKVDNFPAQLIPKLKNSQLNGAKYRISIEKSKEKNIFYDDKISGVVEYKVNYQFLEPGAGSLPLITLPWFDLQNNKWQEAFLPEHNFEIYGKVINLNKQKKITKKISKKITNDKSFHKFYTLLLIVINCIFVIFTLFFLWQRYKYLVKKYYNRYCTNKKIYNACCKNDYLGVVVLLLEYAKIVWPNKNFRGLNDLVIFLSSDELKQLVSELQQIKFGYNNKPLTWDGKKFWNIWKKATNSM